MYPRAEAREAVPVLYYDDAHFGVGQQLRQFGPLVVQTRGDLGDFSLNLIATRRGVVT
jgi:hypothetical protein